MGELEDTYQKDIKEIKEWWAMDHKKHLTRPYTAEEVAQFRNSVKTDYLSSIQARKLWKTLNSYRAAKEPLMTVGCVEPLLASQMSRAGLECVYVSGGVSGLTQVEEPGVDHADYPWDTVPRVVNRIVKSQMWRDRTQRQHLLSLSEEERKTYPQFDFLLPIIADGDMGFGGVTTIAKCTKVFVEAGVAMFHLDDLAIGLKKFTQGIGRTIIPTSEYLKRLTAARFQIDVMGADTLLMSRIDSYQCGFITSVFDARDHKYVMGSTNPDIAPLIKVLADARQAGESIGAAKLKWFKDAAVMTFDEAAEKDLSADEFAAYSKLIDGDKFASLTKRRKYAKEAAPEKTIFFDWDDGRNSYGHYLFKQCIESVIDRAIAALPLTDTTWGRVDAPIPADVEKFHVELSKVSPGRVFGFGYVGAYNFAKAGYTEEQVKNFHNDLAEMGAIWQVQPIFAIQGINMFNNEFLNMWKKEGIFGYARDITKKAEDPAPFKPGAFASWGGGYLADGFIDITDANDHQIPLE
ncbi:mitochondrial 2-methylisocitrate lyase [Yamadazyma tenuis]|uniref:Isocitrate lyase n=1 Tax=Candida tenuis (strain ATCC 10573 / BCRC 21748 / CBS 615 / JCM 9827 / NBRC 10315 / NRRL Y-1498 / VKM Y-70) TaxID=590646 RepID=G3BAR4_CANTC|nr:mitochondrial 2-methylisocitrate lyase [Yamadazyma tenuis ATCC 10573]EGV62090.1 mitochondrial 2-methylisocitrate lyase [Yamadazyma tenuis ATCC 10573]WEJ93338.1 mitochondrial 2-methylisocitrate lyase [Yamadazyma tenuis]